MVALDTLTDNLCLWCCIAVYCGARFDQNIQFARELAKSYFKLRTAPNDVLRTSLDKLDKVERHFNQEIPVSEWLGIRVYEPERQHPRRPRGC